MFRWLYSDLVIVNELLMSWVIAINDSLRKSVEEVSVGSGGWSGHQVTSEAALSSRHHLGAPPQPSDVMAEPDLG